MELGAFIAAFKSLVSYGFNHKGTATLLSFTFTGPLHFISDIDRILCPLILIASAPALLSH